MSPKIPRCKDLNVSSGHQVMAPPSCVPASLKELAMLSKGIWVIYGDIAVVTDAGRWYKNPRNTQTPGEDNN